MSPSDAGRAALLEVFASDVDERAASLDRLAGQLEAARTPLEQARVSGLLSFEAHKLRGSAAMAHLDVLATSCKDLERALQEPDDAAGVLAGAARQIADALRALAARPAGPV